MSVITKKFSINLNANFDKKILFTKYGERFSRATVQIHFYDVTGATKDGTIKILGGSDPASDSFSLIDTVSVNAANNTADTSSVVINAGFACLEIDYAKINVTGGSADITITFEGA